MPEGENQGQGPTPAPEVPPQGGNPPENADQKAELENLKSQVNKLTTQVGQAGFVIQKLKTKLKEEGIDPDEGEIISDEKVRSIVRDTVQPEIQALKETLATKISELGRSITAHQSASSGAGPGQKPPQEDEGEKEPELSVEDKKLLAGYKWDPKRKGHVSPSGRFYPWSESSKGVVTPEK